MLRKLVVEALGTYFLVLVIGQVVLGNAGGFAPLAIGLTLAMLVYAGGHVSGGHYNPAVSVAVWLRGGMGLAEVLPYWVAQVVGGVAGALTAQVLSAGTPTTPIDVLTMPAFIAEFLFTFALCFVVLNVATVRSTDGNSYYGMAIGLVVLAGAYSVGGISGGAFNPAVVAGLMTRGLLSAGHRWSYLAAQLLGAAAAGGIFRALDLGADRQPEAATPVREPMPAGEARK